MASSQPLRKSIKGREGVCVSALGSQEGLRSRTRRLELGGGLEPCGWRSASPLSAGATEEVSSRPTELASPLLITDLQAAQDARTSLHNAN